MSMKVFDDTTVRFAKRVNFDIGCQMDFSRYPIDQQTCPVKIESFGYQTQVLLGLSSDSENNVSCRNCASNGASTNPP